MNIKIRKSALKDLKKIDSINKEKVHAKIWELENFPNVPNIKRLTNFEPAYRLRVGDYRILFDVSENTLVEFYTEKIVTNREKIGNRLLIYP